MFHLPFGQLCSMPFAALLGPEATTRVCRHWQSAMPKRLGRRAAAKCDGVREPAGAASRRRVTAHVSGRIAVVAHRRPAEAIRRSYDCGTGYLAWRPLSARTTKFLSRTGRSFCRPPVAQTKRDSPDLSESHPPILTQVDFDSVQLECPSDRTATVRLPDARINLGRGVGCEVINRSGGERE